MIVGLRGVDFNLLYDTGKLDEGVPVPAPRAVPTDATVPKPKPVAESKAFEVKK